MDCIFCGIVSGNPCHKVWEDESFIAFLDIRPVKPGHTLLMPKRHVDYVFDLEEPLYSGIFKAARRLAVPLKEAMEARRIGLVIQGFLVPHVHIHLVPALRAEDVDLSNPKKAEGKELEENARKIKEAIVRLSSL